ncbi:MAG: PepSY domain-containing protein [Rhizobiales bacterium]|nr:PepSY domain-containing protein [Hyphomicrobiales bacterium]
MTPIHVKLGVDHTACAQAGQDPDVVINLFADMVGHYIDRPRPKTLTSVEEAVATARKTLPAMQPLFVAYPRSMLSSKSHYAVFMKGDTPLTARLLRPVLIDAADGSFADSRTLPWYVSTLLLSQPLHFGDYGGLPLKIVWALLDLATIVILITGLYLWLARRRRKVSEQALIESSIVTVAPSER